MYGFKGNEVVAAQVKYKGQLTENLFRITDSSKRCKTHSGAAMSLGLLKQPLQPT